MNQTDLIIKKAKLKILEAEAVKEKEVTTDSGDIMLIQALDDLLDASSRIPEEERKVREAIAELEKDKDEDKFWNLS